MAIRGRIRLLPMAMAICRRRQRLPVT
jgi:hypothetical protein